jgi:replication-associated recombination protein RarA
VSQIAIHPVTQKMLEKLQASPPQSLLLSGPRGVGLLTIAQWFVGDELAGLLRPQDTKERLDNGNGTISVEMIRRLYDQTRAKYTSRQIVVIDDADRMSRGAQSAFLKLLEEPGAEIYFLLTSHTPQHLLPTVRSRVQSVAVQSLSSADVDQFIDSLGVQEPVRRAQLQFMADGLPAELTRLAADDVYFSEQAETIGDARDFLQADKYTKLLLVQKYRSDRDRTIRLIDSALHILRRSISAKPQLALIDQLKRLLEIRERIEANHNIPLQLALFVI